MDTCAVYFAGVNKRDVLLANGAVKMDDLPGEFSDTDGVLGVEFSGRDFSGKRVMGICAPPALASTVRCSRSSLWQVPTHWTLEEAATAPFAYATAFHALIMNARLRKGETVFVQSGWTPIGQAAITVALSHGCEVFTLTRNQDDVAALLASCPRLKEKHIYSNKDVTFERAVLIDTARKGVDVVLNFNNDSTLKARLGLLAKGSRFVDISFKTDEEAQRAFSSEAWKISSFHKVQLDSALARHQGAEWAELSTLIQEGIQSGVVKPLKRRVYRMRNLVDAFKEASGETGFEKVLIQMRDEEREKTIQTAATSFPCVYRSGFDPAKTYVIIGGLGGLGLELSDWMVGRGVRKLVITSRSNVSTGYQAKKIAHLRKLGSEVVVVPVNVNTVEKAKALVGSASKLGPIGGFFNLGLVIDDKPFTEQTVEEEPVRCTLDYFVMFSSVVGLHGHAGQSNYGFGNSFAERLCERRRLDGLPGEILAIQWGPVADVGFVGKIGNSVVITEKFPQRIQSVKSTFDYMLSQSSSSVVSSYVHNDRSSAVDAGEETVAQKIARAVGKVLGVKDVTSVDGDKEFIELGLDSLMSVEIRQILERESWTLYTPPRRFSR
ncbi:hypothetical protein RRG08_034691 [Elysia crispata]|uniref:Fatty acid synthase n=1 Tax=Elysia crispata TaxID=231223 RepID=A0AAE0Z0U8_9GAST|nr:hypothetical protein RRG08_034691 [Elysia crispata]